MHFKDSFTLIRLILHQLVGVWQQHFKIFTTPEPTSIHGFHQIFTMDSPKRVYTTVPFGCYVATTVAILLQIFWDYIFSIASLSWSLQILTTPQLLPLHGFSPNVHHVFTLRGSTLQYLLVALWHNFTLRRSILH